MTVPTTIASLSSTVRLRASGGSGIVYPRTSATTAAIQLSTCHRPRPTSRLSPATRQLTPLRRSVSRRSDRVTRRYATNGSPRKASSLTTTRQPRAASDNSRLPPRSARKATRKSRFTLRMDVDWLTLPPDDLARAPVASPRPAAILSMQYDDQPAKLRAPRDQAKISTSPGLHRGTSRVREERRAIVHEGRSALLMPRTVVDGVSDPRSEGCAHRRDDATTRARGTARR